MLKKMIRRNKFAEVRNLTTGEVIQFDCRTKDKKRAERKVHVLVKLLEEKFENCRFSWNFKGEDVFFLGTNSVPTPAMKVKERVRSFFYEFFELEA